jgi:hypothetical protein
VNFLKHTPENPLREERFSKMHSRICFLPWLLNRVSMEVSLWVLPNLPTKAGAEDYSKLVSPIVYPDLVLHPIDTLFRKTNI